jgi:hypothetical protein
MQLVVPRGLAPEQPPLASAPHVPVPSLRSTVYVIALFAADEGFSELCAVHVTVTELIADPGTEIEAASSDAVVAEALPEPA